MAQSVVIGTQEWMSRNLDVEYYRDGTPIPQVTDHAAWAALTTGAWCYWNNDPTQGTKYGKLYNWYAMNDKAHGGIAPVGWHIPSDAEWTTLETFLGGPIVAGNKMKSTSGWELDGKGTNSSGFTGLPGGNRIEVGPFSLVGYFGNWWSSTENNTTNAWCRNLFYQDSVLNRYGFNKHYCFSVRCLRD